MKKFITETYRLFKEIEKNALLLCKELPNEAGIYEISKLNGTKIPYTTYFLNLGVYRIIVIDSGSSSKVLFLDMNDKIILTSQNGE